MVQKFKSMLQVIIMVCVLIIATIIVIRITYPTYNQPQSTQQVQVDVQQQVDTVKDSVVVKLPAIIDSTKIHIQSQVYQNFAQASTTIQKQQLYKAQIGIKYFFEEQIFQIDFQIQVQQKTIRQTITKTITHQRKPVLFKPYAGIGVLVSQEQGFDMAIQGGVAIRQRFLLYLQADTSKRYGAGIGILF